MSRRSSVSGRLAGLAVLAVLGAGMSAHAGVVIHVAPDGNDTWSGASARPDAAGKDGPLATLAGARDAVRRLKAKGPLPGPVTVLLAGGTYRLDKAVEFAPEDSGTRDATVTYAAAPGQRAVLSGGRAVTGWHKGEGPLWQARVPPLNGQPWVFHQLFVNGQRRTCARTPNIGFLYTEGPIAPIDRVKWWQRKTADKSGFLYRPGDIRRFPNLGEALIVIYHSWTTSTHFITSLDEQERAVNLAPESGWPIGYWWENHTRYHVENVREALDQPGEWFLDRQAGTVLYWPVAGEDMTRAEVVAPLVRQTLVAFGGQGEQGKFIEHLHFRGLSFRHTECRLAPDMPVDQQGATERSPMIAAQGLRQSTFEDCEIAHAGENGLVLGAFCTDNALRRCHIHDLGGGGVYIGVTGGVTPANAVQRNTVDNCFIHGGSRIFRGSQGVWVGRAFHTQVTRNEICDFHHLGISVGYSWGYAPTTANHNLIAGNHVHHICNGYFSDGGGIYTLGVSPGTVIRNNLVHDVQPTPLMPVGGCGIYLDEGSSTILVENNIVFRVGAAAFTQHYGRENVVRNNIFAFGGKDPICCCRAEEHLSYTFEGNIVVCDKGQAVADHYSPLKCRTEFRRNLYWDISGKEPLFSGVSWEAWRKTGRDADGRIADPRFENLAGLNFRLKPDSPALAMGFAPIATDQIGLYGQAEWTAGPGKLTHTPLPELPPPPPPLPPRPVAEDFESVAPGSLTPLLHASPADRLDALGVCKLPAGLPLPPAGGNHVLKFTKVEGLKYGFQPHAYFSSRRYKEVNVRFACDLMNDAKQPADLYVGLRDYTQKGREYLDGPVLRLGPDGTLTASGKALAKVPNGQWVRLEIVLDLGHGTTAAPATQPATAPTPAAATQPAIAPTAAAVPARGYRLTVTVAGQPPQTFQRLPLAEPTFAEFTWFGFSSVGQGGGTFYVDNLRLEIAP